MPCLQRHLLLLNLSIFLQVSLRGKSFSALQRAAIVRRSPPKHPSATIVRGAPPKSHRAPKKPELDAPVYTRLIISSICNILRYSPWSEAKEKLATLDVKWDSHIVNRVLKAHPPMEKAWLFFCWASGIKGFKHDQYTHTTMLDIFGEAGRVKSMLYVFDKMRERKLKIDAATYTSLMHWLSQSGDFDSAIEIWDQMSRNKCHPTVVTYTAYMKLLIDSGKTDEAARIFKEMIDEGLQPTCVTYTVVMDHLFSAGKWQEALKIFSEMQEAGVNPDKAACNILIKRCCESVNIVAMRRILRYMKETHIVLRYPEFLQALKALEISGEDDELLREVNPHLEISGISNDRLSDDALQEMVLIFFLLKTQKLKAVDFMISDYTHKRKLLTSWLVSEIIESYPESSAYEYSLKMSIKITREAFHSLIGASLKGGLHKMVGIVEEMIKAGYLLGSYTYASLMMKLGRNGMLDCAKKVFDLLPLSERCTCVYTALMYAHFRAGNKGEALEVFRMMKVNRVGPSLGTYNALLGGLRRGGMHFEAEKIMKEMKKCINGMSFLTPSQKICDLLFYSELVAFK